MEIVAAQTGYPVEMLELDLDMEADLGIDTVKQAETFAAIRKAFDIPRRDDLKLRDYPTLRHVVGFVKEMRPELASQQFSSQQLAVTNDQSPVSSPVSQSLSLPVPPTGRRWRLNLPALFRLSGRNPQPST
ncbi:MAG: hypothetical protein IPL78_31255 [Chloroflexi bacterium]|nr:hypothetical protein [Chloroflexota bacterium]